MLFGEDLDPDLIEVFNGTQEVDMNLSKYMEPITAQITQFVAPLEEMVRLMEQIESHLKKLTKDIDG